MRMPSTICTTVRVATLGWSSRILNSGQASTMAATAVTRITGAGPTRSARVPTNGTPTRVTTPLIMPPR